MYLRSEESHFCVTELQYGDKYLTTAFIHFMSFTYHSAVAFQYLLYKLITNCRVISYFMLISRFECMYQVKSKVLFSVIQSVE